MFEVINTITGEKANVFSDTPYVLAGPLGERKEAQKVDEHGNLLYLSATEILDEEGNPTDEFAETTETGYYIEVVDGYDENNIPTGFHQEFINYTPVIVDDGAVFEWVEIIPTPAEIAQQIQTELTNAVQEHLDATAKLKGYDGILSAASYAALPVGEPFQAEGTQYALWRSAVWVKCYEILQEVLEGTREKVPTADELLAELPAIEL